MDRTGRPWSYAEIAYILESDKTTVELSKILGRSTRTIYIYRQKYKDVDLTELKNKKDRFDHSHLNPLYTIWVNFRQKCRIRVDSDLVKAAYYTYYKPWDDFGVFKQWSLENGYQPGFYFLRKDTFKGFYPENCYFSEELKILKGTHVNAYWEYEGELKTLKEWSDIFEINFRQKLNYYIKKMKMDPENYPYHNRQLKVLIDFNNEKFIEYNGEKHTVTEWAEILGITRQAFYARRKKGLSLTELLTPNKRK